MAEKNFNRSKNAKRNIIFGLIYKISSLIIPFATRTIIIRILGAEYLGLSGLFSSLIQVLSLTELGFGSAIVFSMYKPIAEDDIDEICALLHYYRKIYYIVGSTIFIVGILVLPFLPHLINGSWPDDINIYILFILYLFGTSISYSLFAYKQSLFIAYQRNDILYKISLLVMLITNLAQIIVLLLWRNYYIYVAVHLSANIISNISVHYLSKNAFPGISCKGVLNEEKKKELRTKVKGLMINKLSQTSRNAFDSIFVSSFIGLIDTAKYNNYFFIISAVSGVLNIVYHSILAGVGNSIIIENQRKNHNDMQRFNFIHMWIAGWSSVCLVCLYQPFIELVFGTDMLFPFEIAVLFTLYFYLLKMCDIRYVYTDAVGLWWENRHRAIVEAAANFILNYTLGKLYGVKGIVFATIISMFLFNFFWGSKVLYKHYFTQFKMIIFFKQHAINAFGCLLCAGITYGLCSLICFNGIWGLVMKGSICFIVPNILFFLLYRKTKIFIESMIWIEKRFHLPNMIHNILFRYISS